MHRDTHRDTHSDLCLCLRLDMHKHKHKMKERVAEPWGGLELFPNQRRWGKQERPSVSTLGTLSGLQTNIHSLSLSRTHTHKHTQALRRIPPPTNSRFFRGTHLKPCDMWGCLWSNRRQSEVTHARTQETVWIPVWKRRFALHTLRDGLEGKESDYILNAAFSFLGSSFHKSIIRCENKHNGEVKMSHWWLFTRFREK